MSHFTTAVILKDINDLEATLAPYDENLEVEPYIEKTSQELIKNAKERALKIDINAELSDYEKLLIKCKTDEDYLKAYLEYWNEEKYDFNHNLLSTYNPKSKWDWWTLCSLNEFARFKNSKMPKGFMKVKDWVKTFSFNKKAYDEAIRYWEVVVEHKPLQENEDEEDFFNFYKDSYYIETYGNKEHYANIEATYHYWAFVLNGEWIEKGEMGWFGFNDATKSSIDIYLDKWKEVINDPKYQDYYIAVVDCHI